MRRAIISIGFVALASIGLANLIACSPVRNVHAGEQAGFVGQTPVTNTAPVPTQQVGPSCANPTPERAAGCHAEADRVLASTVRLELHGAGDIGHATVIGGRYLITHNHYSISGEALSRGGDGLISAISVLKANGDVILLKAPLSYFNVVLIVPEMLVLDFREYGGVGFFDGLGVPSADFVSLNGLSIKPGSEVAQIDWDGTTAHVVWTRVTAIQMDGEPPFMELDTFVELGSSGGGVFYNGVHIANTWLRNTERQADTGVVLRQYSVAALNTESTLTLIKGAPEVTSSTH